MNEEFNAYEDGALFAHEVQQSLAECKSFDDLHAFPPERAAHIRDIWRSKDPDDEFSRWWDWYCSRWN